MQFLNSFTRQVRKMPRDMALILLAALIANTASSAYSPFLPLYLETLGATVEQVGLFFTVNTVVNILFRFLGGWISDTLGRLQAIAISGVLGALSLVGFALAPSWEWAIIGALVASMGGALHAPSFQAFTAESAPEGETASMFGLVGSLFQICQIAGPMLGGFLVENTSYKILLWTAAGIFGVAAALRVWMARRERFIFRSLNPSSLGRDLRMMVALLAGGGLILWIFVVDGMHDAGFQVAFPFIPKYVTEVGGQTESMYGSLYAELAIMAALFTWAGGMLADRFGERWGVAVGGFLQGVALVAVVLFPDTAGFAVGFGLFGLGTAFIGPALNALMSRAVPRESLGMMYGLLWSALGVAAVPAPYVGGWLYDHAGPHVPFAVAAGVLLLTIPLVLWKLRAPEQNSNALVSD